MPEVILDAAHQRALLHAFLDQREVRDRQDPFQRTFDALVAECLLRDELALGCAVVALIGLRAIDREAEAAGKLMALAATSGGWRVAGGEGEEGTGRGFPATHHPPPATPREGGAPWE